MSLFFASMKFQTFSYMKLIVRMIENDVVFLYCFDGPTSYPVTMDVLDQK